MSSYSEETLHQALSRCDSEPIHQLGRIQPQGFLLVLSPTPERQILQVSANLGELLGQEDSESLLNRPLDALLGEAVAAEVERLIEDAEKGSVSSAPLTLKGRHGVETLQARLFFSDEMPVLELIQDSQAPDELSAIIVKTQRALLRIGDEQEEAAYMQQVAEVARTLSGFDRVMVYRFDGNWDGEVIAECLAPGLDSYLGNRFPASDIPPQARALYARNPLRQVHDIDARGVALLPRVNPLTHAPLDLSLSALRSFSPVHVEYLNNMGVKASLSISLWQNGRLWGLIACHHMSPRSLPVALQEAAIGLSQAASSKLSAMESRLRQDLGNEVSGIIGKLLSIIGTDRADRVLDQLQGELLGLLDATGLLVLTEGTLHGMGQVPSQGQLESLMDWLQQQPEQEVFVCDHLAERLEPAREYVQYASGLLAAPWDGDRRNALIWLRPERLRTVRWAGNPEKTLTADASGAVQLSPRTSFKAWTESWRGRSQAWSLAQQDAAGLLARALTEGLAQKYRLEQERARHRDMQQRYYLALNATNDGIWDWDCANDRIQINSAYAQMLGFTVDELGHSVDELLVQRLSADQRERTLGEMRQRLKRDGGYEMDLRLQCKDGSYRWVLSRASLIERDAQGQPLRVVGTHTDLTGRKQLEMQLREAKEHAEAASRSKSVFLATMSHELRTPLNGILGMLELARMQYAHDQELLQRLDIAVTSSQELLVLINDLLDFTEVEADKLNLLYEEFNLEGLLLELRSLLLPEAQKKGLGFDLEVSPALMQSLFRGDGVRLIQVLRHLLSNAIKFTQTGSVALNVREHFRMEQSVTLRFEVRDSGIGIAEADQARLFGLFEQLDGAANRRFGGCGFGLILSKRLVELMGGSIGVSSKPGSGSTFWFSVELETVREPLRLAAQESPPLADMPAPATAPEGPVVAAEPVDLERLQPLARELFALLEMGNVRVFNLVESHAELLQAASADDYAEMIQALNDFDFDRASEGMRALMDKVGITP